MRLIARAIRTQSRLIWKCLSSSLLSPLFQIKLWWHRCLYPWWLVLSRLRRRQAGSGVPHVSPGTAWGLAEVTCIHNISMVGCWLRRFYSQLPSHPRPAPAHGHCSGCRAEFPVWLSKPRCGHLVVSRPLKMEDAIFVVAVVAPKPCPAAQRAWPKYF